MNLLVRPKVKIPIVQWGLELPAIYCFENLDRQSRLKNFQVSQNMISSSEPSANQTLDQRSVKHFRIA